MYATNNEEQISTPKKLKIIHTQVTGKPAMTIRELPKASLKPSLRINKASSTKT